MKRYCCTETGMMEDENGEYIEYIEIKKLEIKENDVIVIKCKSDGDVRGVRDCLAGIQGNKALEGKNNSIWIMTEELDVSIMDEKEMVSFGWVRKEDK